MRRSKEFPFERARRITAQEMRLHRKAIANKLGAKRVVRGRPPKHVAEKYHAIAIRLHPKILKWAKGEAKKQGLGYQTVINRLLLKYAA